MASTVHVKGLAELGRALQRFDEKMRKRLVRGALRAGARIIELRAESIVPVKSGKLKRSIRISTKQRGTLVIASVKAGATGKKGDAFYGHMVERGTRPHSLRPKLRKAIRFADGSFARGRIEHPGAKADPFLNPALQQAAGQALEVAAAYLRNRIAVEGAR